MLVLMWLWTIAKGCGIKTCPIILFPLERAMLQLLLEVLEGWLSVFCLSESTIVWELLAW